MSWTKNARYSIQAYLQHDRMSNNGTMLHEPAKKGEVMTFDLQDFAGEDYCYLTTTGRITGRPHTVEIWFALHNQTLYILSVGMNLSDWFTNELRYPRETNTLSKHSMVRPSRQ